MRKKRGTIATRGFIVGCPRSGTTLLRNLLGGHPNITVFPESRLFQHLEAYRPAARRLRLASRRSRRPLAIFLKKLQEPPEFEDSPQNSWLKEGAPELSPALVLPRLPLVRSYARSFVRLLDDVADRWGTTVWVEKTPENLHHIDLIESLVPKARFLHAVRSGEDVVASIYEKTHSPEEWWRRRYPTIDHCVRAWNAAIQVTLSHVSKPNHALVFYEDLVTVPELELRRVCSFLGVAFDARMVSSTQIRYEPHAKFKRLFTKKEQAHIMESLLSLDDLRSRNVEPAGSGSSAGESGATAGQEIFGGVERTE